MALRSKGSVFAKCAAEERFHASTNNVDPDYEQSYQLT